METMSWRKRMRFTMKVIKFGLLKIHSLVLKRRTHGHREHGMPKGMDIENMVCRKSWTISGETSTLVRPKTSLYSGSTIRRHKWREDTSLLFCLRMCVQNPQAGGAYTRTDVIRTLKRGTEGTGKKRCFRPEFGNTYAVRERADADGTSEKENVLLTSNTRCELSKPPFRSSRDTPKVQTTRGPRIIQGFLGQHAFPHWHWPFPSDVCYSLMDSLDLLAGNFSHVPDFQWHVTTSTKVGGTAARVVAL